MSDNPMCPNCDHRLSWCICASETKTKGPGQPHPQIVAARLVDAAVTKNENDWYVKRNKWLNGELEALRAKLESQEHEIVHYRAQFEIAADKLNIAVKTIDLIVDRMTTAGLDGPWLDEVKASRLQITERIEGEK